MRSLRFLTCAGCICCCIAAMSGCTDNPIDTPQETRVPLFQDSFETDLPTIYKGYSIINTNQPIPFWSLSTDCAHSGKSSAKSDSNLTGMKKMFDPAIDSGTVGCEFYLMAEQAGRANFVVFIGKDAGSAGGTMSRIGMGFDTSDSVKYTFFDGIPVLQEYKTVAKIVPGHWYKCRITYAFSTHMAGFFLDDVKVGGMELENMYPFDVVVAYRDDAGSQGPKKYYLDDLLFYTVQ